ncbi:MAG: hypothetical protein AAFY88_09615 [Acidobacteriota bacterium]
MKSWKPLWIVALGLALTPAWAEAQPVYSIDYQGPTLTLPDSALGLPIGAGDLLIPGVGTPAIVLDGMALGLTPSPATAQIEINALSQGRDSIVAPVSGPPLLFSVDEFAIGRPGAGRSNVFSEGAFGNQQASADVFRRVSLPALPLGPGSPGRFRGRFDGDGIPPFAGPGLNLIEPNPPTLAGLPDPGDNVDAFNCRFDGPPTVYFSLDGPAFDPLEAVPNSNSALANGFSSADILFSTPGGAPVVFAAHFALGLIPQDDIDALILNENGNGVFDPSVVLFDWMTGATDQLFFSLNRNSPTLGTPDAIFGVPIEEGDVLTVTPTGPGILIAAERLGLRTFRSHGPGPFSAGDNVDALSVFPCF